jgi:hypothetical protein
MKSVFFVLGSALATKPTLLMVDDKEGGTARASFSYTPAGGLAIETNGCVDRSSWCGRWKRDDCPASNAPALGKLRLNKAGEPSRFVQLQSDGTLSFHGRGCVQPISEWTEDPGKGLKLGSTDDDSAAFIAIGTTHDGIALHSKVITVQGLSIEPECGCAHGSAHTASCMAHGDQHCETCDAGFLLSGKVCIPATCENGNIRAGDCTCGSGYFGGGSHVANSPSFPRCNPWTTCPAGEGQSFAGTPTSDRACAPCVLGTSFSGANDALDCQAADVCGAAEYEKVAATLSADRTCAAHAAECASHEYQSRAPDGMNDRECKQKVCLCPHGVHTAGDACPKHGHPKCASCIGAYHLANGNQQCDGNQCKCVHGTVATGAACTQHGATKCTSCNGGYHMLGNNCVLVTAAPTPEPTPQPTPNPTPKPTPDYAEIAEKAAAAAAERSTKESTGKYESASKAAAEKTSKAEKQQKDDAERATKAEASAKSFERKSKADAEEKQAKIDAEKSIKAEASAKALAESASKQEAAAKTAERNAKTNERNGKESSAKITAERNGKAERSAKAEASAKATAERNGKAERSVKAEATAKAKAAEHNAKAESAAKPAERNGTAERSAKAEASAKATAERNAKAESAAKTAPERKAKARKAKARATSRFVKEPYCRRLVEKLAVRRRLVEGRAAFSNYNEHVRYHQCKRRLEQLEAEDAKVQW